MTEKSMIMNRKRNRKQCMVFNIFSLRKGAEQHFHPGTLRRFIFAVSNSHVIHPNIF